MRTSLLDDLPDSTWRRRGGSSGAGGQADGRIILQAGSLMKTSPDVDDEDDEILEDEEFDEEAEFDEDDEDFDAEEGEDDETWQVIGVLTS
jgi:hypothetical protein